MSFWQSRQRLTTKLHLRIELATQSVRLASHTLYHIKVLIIIIADSFPLLDNLLTHVDLLLQTTEKSPHSNLYRNCKQLTAQPRGFSCSSVHTSLQSIDKELKYFTYSQSYDMVCLLFLVSKSGWNFSVIVFVFSIIIPKIFNYFLQLEFCYCLFLSDSVYFESIKLAHCRLLAICLGLGILVKFPSSI